MRKLLVLLTLLPLLASCSFLKGLASSSFEKPSVAFRDVKLDNIDFNGADINVLLDVTNPNSGGLDLAQADYRLNLDGHDVLTGQPKTGLQIPGGATSTLTLPAHVVWDQLAPAVLDVLSKDTLQYTAGGTVGFNSPLGLLSLPFEKQGTIAPPHLPDFELQSPRILSLGFSGARIALPLKITNKNGFPLPLGGADGIVQIEGAKVGRVTLAQQPAIGASQAQVVELPLDVSFASAGFAVASALKSGHANVKLDGALRALGKSLPLHIEQSVEFRRDVAQ
jgi:LEA14-like dessication related protein